MKLLKTSERGRSMIEMLGVLAIVGILSVGGINGFSKAMRKHKINQAIEQYSQVFSLIVNDSDKWKRIYEISSGSYYRLSSLWKKMDVLPKSMIKNPTDENLYDVFGNKFYVRKFSPYIEWGIYMNSGESNVFSLNAGSQEICQAIILNALTPWYEDIRVLFLYLGGGNNASSKYSFYGDQYCEKSKKCFKDITVSDVSKMCADCEDDKLCRIAILFPL